MAFGLYCKRCGHQESEHGDPRWPEACKAYDSPDPKGELHMWAEEQKRDAERYRRRGPAYET